MNEAYLVALLEEIAYNTSTSLHVVDRDTYLQRIKNATRQTIPDQQTVAKTDEKQKAEKKNDGGLLKMPPKKKVYKPTYSIEEDHDKA